MDNDNLIISLVSGAVAGTLIAITDRLLDDRKKVKSQLVSLRSQAERTRGETARLSRKDLEFKRRFELLEASLAETKYHLTPSINENVVYDGTDGIEGFDVVAIGRRNNCHFFNNKVLIIDRMGKKGVCQLQLRKYTVAGQEYDFFAASPNGWSKRRLRVSFEARVLDGEHALSLAFTTFHENRLLGKQELNITATDWEMHDLYFEVPARQDCLLQIVDLFQSRSGDLQIRNLVLAEQARHPQTNVSRISEDDLDALMRAEN